MPAQTARSTHSLVRKPEHSSARRGGESWHGHTAAHEEAELERRQGRDGRRADRTVTLAKPPDVLTMAFDLQFCTPPPCARAWRGRRSIRRTRESDSPYCTARPATAAALGRTKNWPTYDQLFGLQIARTILEFEHEVAALRVACTPARPLSTERPAWQTRETTRSPRSSRAPSPRCNGGW